MLTPQKFFKFCKIRRSGYYLIIGWLACANQGMPPGGPEDRTLPFIFENRLVPGSGATKVPLDIAVQIEFNERIDHQSLQDAFFISPFPHGGIEFDWQGRRLKLKFPQGLENFRTYVITIGADTRDLRRNAMLRSFTFAFATGDTLDQGQIAGQLYSTGALEGFQIWAYSLTTDSTPNPRQTEANYITQCSKTGEYVLQYLRPEPYRLFAIQDKDLNRIYDPEYDLIGICTKDAWLAPDSLVVQDCNFQLTQEDTTRPGLYRIAAADNRHLSLRFDEAIVAPEKDLADRVLIQHLEAEKVLDTLKFTTIYQNPQDLSRLELITEPQLTGAKYRVTVSDFVDWWQNPIEPRYRSAEFEGSSLPDTTGPQVIYLNPADSSRQVVLNQKIELIFSEAIQESAFYRTVTITDTLGVPPKGSWQQLKPTSFQFTPATRWSSQMRYAIKLPDYGGLDRFGNAQDSAQSWFFTTIAEDTLSAISGNLQVTFPFETGGFYLKATRLQSEAKTLEIFLEKPGGYVFENILPGNYLISGFHDRDQNQRYSYGRIKPFIPAERFFYQPDTITVRARWPNEGNDIIFKQ